MKENFDCGNPNDPGWGNNWPTEDLTPGFRDITEDVFQVESLEDATCCVTDKFRIVINSYTNCCVAFLLR